MKFKQIPNPYIVSVLHEYHNERPENVLCNIGALPEHNGFRRSVLDALVDSHQSVQVSYDTLSEYCPVVNTGDIKGSVTLCQCSDRIDFDGYTIGETMIDEEEELDYWIENNESSPLLEIFKYLRSKIER